MKGFLYHKAPERAVERTGKDGRRTATAATIMRQEARPGKRGGGRKPISGGRAAGLARLQRFCVPIAAVAWAAKSL
jgi:hypothetical protein